MQSINESLASEPQDNGCTAVGSVDAPSASATSGNNGLPIHSIEEKLRGQIEGWRRRLLDLGNRNALIKCSFDKSRGVVEIVHPSCETVWQELVTDSEAGSVSMRLPWRRDLVPPPADWSATSSMAAEGSNPASGAETKKPKEKEWDPPLSECLASDRLQETDLIADFSDKTLDRRLRTLNGYAALSLSEQGVHCLYMVFGFLKWFESIDSEEPIFSPLMLVPVSLSRRTADAPWEIFEAEDDAIENRCLRERLRQDFKLTLPPLPDIDQLEADGSRLDYLASIRQAIAGNDRWEVVDRCVLGRFAFPKVAMWQDLGDHGPAVLSHLLCRSIGGDTAIGPGQVFGAADGLPEARRLDDEIAPGEIKAILDCDSSQLEAVVAARRGVSFVLDGPPGTGKSQTIANIIADALAEGRKVLFVSEKVSALEVVKRRLDDAGLGEFCLECHSSKANRKAILDELKWCLDLPTEVYNDARPKLKEAHDRRRALNDYVRSIHRAREPLGLSAFELFGRVSHLNRQGLSTKTRCNLPAVSTVDPSTMSRWLDLLGQAKDVTEVLENHDAHPWRGCLLTARTLSLTDDLQYHLSTLIRAFRLIDESTRRLSTAGLLPFPVSPGRMGELSKLLKETLSIPEVPQSWFLNPQRISGAVLQRIEADGTILDQLGRLESYVTDVADHFPIEAAEWLSQPVALASLERIKSPVPSTLRAQRDALAAIRSTIAELESASIDSNSSLTTLIQRLTLPLRAALPIGSIPKFAKLARIIADSLPMRPAWFDADRVPAIRRLVEDSLSKVGRLKQIQAASTSVTTDQLGLLGRSSLDLDSLRGAWKQVSPHCPGIDHASLIQLKTILASATGMLRRIQPATTALLGSVGVSTPVPLNLSRLKALLEATPSVLSAAPIHGAWNDATVRARLKHASESAIGDLAEAAEIRERLQERMSHRAFKSSAADLAVRGAQYGSIVRRWTGGFGAFQKEVSELYKNGVPSAKQLLGDLSDLRKHHARVNDCREAASELSDSLPSSHSAEDVTAWTKIGHGVTAVELLASTVPEIATALPKASIACDAASANRSLESLQADVAQIECLLQGTPLQHTLNQADELEVVLAKIERQLEDAETVLEGFAATRHQFSPEPDLNSWLSTLELAKEHASLKDQLAASADLNPEVMPSGDSAEDATWKRIRSGVELAEKVRPLVKSPDPVIESFCGQAEIDPTTIHETADRLEETHQRFIQALQQALEVVNLSTTEATSEETQRQTLESLLARVRGIGSGLDERLGRLTPLERLIRENTDVAVEDLHQHSLIVGDIRAARFRRIEADEILTTLQATRPDELEAGGFDAADWLAAATVTPICKSVATDPQVRNEVSIASEKIRVAGSPEFAAAWKFLRSLFDVKASVSVGFVPFETPVGELAERLQSLIESAPALDEWLKFSRWQQEMIAAGFGEVVSELIRGSFSPEEAVDVVTARFYRQVFDHLAENDPLLRDFDLEAHDRLRKRFRELDEWEVRAAATQIRQYQLGRSDRPRPGWNIPVTSELGILQKEIQKKRRHLPLRRLFAEIPGVLQRLKPCIMMSPLSVSTFLQSETIRFDLVIFDEASQVFPWDAIGAIYRGSQLIVAGDEQQLPPTDFFSRSEGETDDENEEGDEIGDFGSILSVCKSINMPGKRLRWHYRSRREPLITFSNRHFYEGELVTFPSVRDASHDAVTLDLVPDGKWLDQKNIPEAERIADLIIAHHRSSRHASLGVIAFNRSQQRAIEDILFERRKKDPEIDSLLSAGLSEPLFIKNLENVQGDERDVILLSMGFARNEAGKFSKNFGPLSRKGGQRRLNVAVTRAREQLTFVASVRAADMDLTPSMSLGAHLLKAYLEYAERGVDSMANQATLTNGQSESPFEQEVATALIARGLEPVPQVGCGGFRIDLALKHPKWPGRFCLGIECDGATYHSSHTARDRDRIRQSVLEQLGWQIVRVWSTDWVRQPERQIEKILKAYEKASVVEEWPLPEVASASAEEASPDLDLQPRIVEQKQQASRSFGSIDEVSSEQIRTVLAEIVRGAGATPEDDLMRLAARQLGFGRTGRKIRERIEETLHGAIRSGTFQRTDDRIALVR
ncbi:ATP-dependent RecD-like DNA helicase [Caulifigura coniformis]|uniref:ATP-dependent RecD-like DNA helicase n=1 Tax=Caulifigura coniformis TaxID=2527983 RepID=A0A517S9N6_9PLAN|nr:DUF4011 domain-containing protein [Caulifigura coniformis]QDT52806.1 ATP-dependent RecD-like DNA helicase [Caulifigura coniformis]